MTGCCGLSASLIGTWETGVESNRDLLDRFVWRPVHNGTVCFQFASQPADVYVRKGNLTFDNLDGRLPCCFSHSHHWSHHAQRPQHMTLHADRAPRTNQIRDRARDHDSIGDRRHSRLLHAFLVQRLKAGTFWIGQVPAIHRVANRIRRLFPKYQILYGQDKVSYGPVLLADAAGHVRAHDDTGWPPVADRNHDTEHYRQVMDVLWSLPQCVGYHLCGAHIRNNVRRCGFRDHTNRLIPETVDGIRAVNAEMQQRIRFT